MIIVLLVLSGLVAISYPLLRKPLNKIKLQAVAQEISTEFNNARLKAMQSGIAQHFETDDNKFQIVSQEESSAEKEFPNGINFKMVEETIFYPDGNTTNSTISIQNEDSQMDIKLNSLTNSVRIECR